MSGGFVSKGRGKASVTLRREDALMYVGYAGQQLDQELQERFESCAHACEHDHEVAYVWQVEDIASITDEGVTLAGSGLVLPGHDIARHLEGCRHVALFACTLGHSCERELARRRSLESLDFLLYDCCASALAESGAHAVQELLGQEARRLGLCAHARFSPGYGDMGLGVQPAFLAALDAGRVLGLTVNDHGFLVPTKSVTAVLGFFDSPEDDAPSPCGLCAAREYCCYRERGTTCHGR